MTDVAARIAARTRREGGCLIWQGAKTGDGYGAIKVNGRCEYVHRLAYTIANGPIPAGTEIDHVTGRGCRSKACCEPTHLEAVTHAENVQRGDVGKLTAADVAAIRASDETAPAIAPRYGIAERYVYEIRANATWKEAA